MGLESLKQKFFELFSKVCVGNRDIAEFLFYVFMGKYLKGKVLHYGHNLPLNLHLIIFLPSSRGKGQAMKVIELIINSLPEGKIKLGRFVETTAAALVGTRDETGKKAVGLLEEVDILIYPEGGTILTRSLAPHFANIRQILQEAMDDKGSIGKGLAGFRLQTEVSSSIIITTCEMDSVDELLANHGLLQRALVVADKNDVDFKKLFAEIAEKSVEFDNSDIKRLTKEFIEELEKIPPNTNIAQFERESYKKGYQDVLQLVNKLLSEFKNKRRQGLLESFAMRTLVKWKKVSAINAFCNGRDTVIEEDYSVALDVIKKHLYNVLCLVNELEIKASNRDDKLYRVVCDVLKKNPLINKGTLVNILIRNPDWNKGFTHTQNQINNWVKEGRLIEQTGNKHNEKFISLPE